jgi:hypothetical protein
MYIIEHNFSRSVFGVGASKKKVISEEIIETVEDLHESSAPGPPKKISRISYDPSEKSGTQVCVFIVSCFIVWCFGPKRDIKRRLEKMYTLESHDCFVLLFNIFRMTD